MFRSRRRLAGILIFASACVSAMAAPPLTTIQDVLYKADGSRFNGLAVISWPGFTASDNSNIAMQTLAVPIVNGNLTVQLVPTTTAITTAQYTVSYSSNGKIQFSEVWAVPPSATPLPVIDVRTLGANTVAPAADTQITIANVIGLSTELTARPTQGSSFTVSRAAVIDSNGQIDGAGGNLSDCLHVDSSSGPCGLGTTAFIDGELPNGTQNGVNALFHLSNAPNPQTSLALFRNGLLLRPNTDYTLSATTLTFLGGAIPQPTDSLLSYYRLGASLPGVTYADAETPGGAVNGVNATFNLVNAPNPPVSLNLYRNGLLMKPNVDYTLNGAIVSFLTASIPQNGDVLLSSYRH